MRRDTSWIRRAALVAFGVAAGVVFGEIALRTVVPISSAITFDLYYRDAHGQLRLQPSARRQHVTNEWNVAIATNRNGFRDRDAPPAKDDRVVLALGDSLAFGWGVERDEMFLTRLEASLPRFRVLNAAVPGTGPGDQLDLARQLLPTEKPTVVLVAFFVGNDFQDVAGGGAAQYDIVDGLLLRRGEGRDDVAARLRSWIKRKSYLAQVVAQGIWSLQHRRPDATPVETRAHPGLAGRDRWLRTFIQIHLREPLPPDLQRGVDGTFAAFDELAALSTRHGARLVVLVIPRSIQIYDADRLRYENAFGLGADDWDIDRPERLIAAWASARHIETIDLLPALRRAAPTGPRLYYFPDSHMTAAGHAVVAEALARYFREHLP